MKNIKFYLIIFLLLITFNVKAGYSDTVNDSSKINVKTFERTEENNYGVKKNWTNYELSYVKNTKYVDATKKIYDFAGRLTDEEEDELRTRILSFYEQTQTELIIVFDTFSYIEDSENDDYATDFYDFNDFGLETTNYDGILLLVNSYDNPYYDMYTFGEAQSYFNSTRYNDILDTIYYNIKSKDNCKAGALKFITMVNNYYYDGPIKSTEYDSDYSFSNTIGDRIINSLPYIFGISFVVTLIVIIVMWRKNKMVKLAKEASIYLERNTYTLTNNTSHLVSSHTTSYRINTNNGGGGHSGGFSGGSSIGHSGGGFSHGGGRH